MRYADDPGRAFLKSRQVSRTSQRSAWSVRLHIHGVWLAALGVSFSHGKLESMSFTRITVRGDQMGGVPCIRGLRIPVATVVGMLADGMNDPEILAAYPDLEAEDIREAMRYAAEAVRERELPLVASA
jgi:uncharacterized protein (DUF433 family)